MPAKKNVKKKVIRKKKANFSKNKTTMSGPFRKFLSSDPIKPRMSCKLSYSDSITLTTGTAGIYGSEQVYRLNSLFDPDLTSAGHQPLFFDQLSAMYNQYMVRGCKLELTFTDPSADGLEVAACIQNSRESYAIASKSPGTLGEQCMTVVKPLNNTGNQVTKIESYVDLRRVEGVTKTQFEGNLSQYSAVTAASPTLTPYLRFAVASLRATGGVTCVCNVRLTYYCQFWDRLIPSQS